MCVCHGSARNCVAPQRPMVITPNHSGRKTADRNVKKNARACLRQYERVSLAPYTVVSDSIRLTKPADALQIVVSKPNERMPVVPSPKFEIRWKTKSRDSLGR